MKNKSVIKNSSAIQIENKINLLQRRAWNVLLANAYNDLPNQETHQLKIKDLLKVLKVETRNKKYLKKTLKGLATCGIEWNILNKDGKEKWGVSTLLAQAEISDGICTYAYSPFLREKLHNPDMYARINLSMQNKFDSKHSLALYELCIDYYIAKIKYGETPFISIEKFRRLMGFSESQYREFKILKANVIRVALKEINDKSDLFVEAEYKRSGRRISDLKFHIKPNPDKADKILQRGHQKRLSPPDIKNSELYDRLINHFLLSPEQAEWAVINFSEDRLSANMEYVEKRFLKGEIENIGSYTLKIIKENIRYKKSLFDVEKEEQEKKKKIRKTKKQKEADLKDVYNKFRLEEINKYKETLSVEDLKKTESYVLEKVKKEHPGRRGQKIFVKFKMIDYLAESANIPTFKKWKSLQP